jgi:hypothetical protein
MIVIFSSISCRANRIILFVFSILILCIKVFD